MNRLSVALVILAVASMACGLTDENSLATSLAATRLEEAVELTATAISLEAIATQTPSPTPTLTPLPQTPTSSASLDELSAITLLEFELPDGFAQIPPEELGFSEAEIKALMAADDLSVGSVFSFLHDAQFQFLIGWTVFLPDRVSRAAFDAEINRPESLLDALVASLEAGEVTDSKILPIPGTIGDASTAVTLALRFPDGALPLRMDFLAFRRELLGVFIFEAYVDGEPAQAPIVDVARTIDSKIQSALQ